MSVRAALDRLTEGDVPAVVHPLGFACLRVRDGLCCHVWLPGEPELEPTVETSPIHCHRWRLESHVLAGEVGNAVFTVRPSNQSAASHRVYDVRVEPDADVIRPTGQYVRAAPGCPTYFGPGQSYTLPAGVFHISIIDKPAVTLLTAVRVPGVRDRVLGPLIPPANRSTRRRTASPALTAQVADLAIRSLKEYS